MSYPRVHITEECMREGMQIEPAGISIDDKVRLLDALSRTGLKTIMVGSFVSPKYTPQMAQIDELMECFTLIEAVWLLEEIIGRPTPGKVSKAGPPPVDPEDFYDPNLPFVETHEEARHFKLGPQVAEHQVRPWREPIPAPAVAQPAAAS